MYLRYSKKGFKGIRMGNATWWEWGLSFAASLFMMGLSFCRSNSQELFGVEKINPFYWWLFVGWLTTYVGIKNWEFTRGEIGPVHALIFFTVCEVIFDVVAYSALYGFKSRYVVAIILVVAAVLIMSWPEGSESEKDAHMRGTPCQTGQPPEPNLPAPDDGGKSHN
jgi:hypothetical protein